MRGQVESVGPDVSPSGRDGLGDRSIAPSSFCSASRLCGGVRAGAVGPFLTLLPRPRRSRWLRWPPARRWRGSGRAWPFSALAGWRRGRPEPSRVGRAARPAPGAAGACGMTAPGRSGRHQGACSRGRRRLPDDVIDVPLVGTGVPSRPACGSSGAGQPRPPRERSRGRAAAVARLSRRQPDRCSPTGESLARPPHQSVRKCRAKCAASG